MTATDQSVPRRARGRTLRADLLDDLRQAAPMPAGPPRPAIPPAPAVRATPPATPALPIPLRPAIRATPPATPTRIAPLSLVSVRPAADRPSPARPEVPTVELRVTPKLWFGLRMKTLGEGSSGVVIGAGLVQISLSGFRR